MAASPKYKIFQHGEYLGSLKRPSDVAVLISVLGPGSSVRLGHAKRDTLLVVTEENHAAICDSYDETEDTILSAESNHRARHPAMS